MKRGSIGKRCKEVRSNEARKGIFSASVALGEGHQERKCRDKAGKSRAFSQELASSYQ
jgi:hypothetical protein